MCGPDHQDLNTGWKLNVLNFAGRKNRRGDGRACEVYKDLHAKAWGALVQWVPRTEPLA